MSSQAEETGRTAVWPNHNNTRGRYGWTQGTSVSSPIVAGIIALMLEANPTLTPEIVVQILQQTATKDQYTGNITTPDVRWGAGKVNALEAIKSMGIPVASSRRDPLSSRPQALLLVRSGRNILTIKGFSGTVPRDLAVQLFDMRGRLLTAIPIRGNCAIHVPEAIARGCFIVKLKWVGGSSEAQVFTKM
jgi:hypothetical protein